MSTDQTVKAGDLLYAVGPAHNPPQGPADLRVYSAPVKHVRLQGSFSESATPADRASAVSAIELSDDRPHLGFPKWVYQSYEVGINVHLSAADALRAFAAHARTRRDQAGSACARAEREITWALDEIAIIDNTFDADADLTEAKLLRIDELPLDRPPMLNALAKHVGIRIETVNPDRVRWYATPKDGPTFEGTYTEISAYVRGYATAALSRLAAYLAKERS